MTEINELRAELERVKAEYAKMKTKFAAVEDNLLCESNVADELRVELSAFQESEFHPDWSMLQATRDSLKATRSELERARADLNQSSAWLMEATDRAEKAEKQRDAAVRELRLIARNQSHPDGPGRNGTKRPGPAPHGDAAPGKCGGCRASAGWG